MIDEGGERLGVMSLAEAQAAARERELDLVEVAPASVPPVCRILDYGKFKYQQAKKERGTKHQHLGQLREVRFKVKISDHDMEMKLRRAERFLKEGSKVKLSVMFRGREMAHPDIGRALLLRAQEHLEDVAIVDKPPSMVGRFMNMILGPTRGQSTEKESSSPKAKAGKAKAGKAKVAEAKADEAKASEAKADEAKAVSEG